MIRFLSVIISLLCVMTVFGSTKRALLIGLSEYVRHADARLDWPSVHGADDARMLASTLRRQGFITTTLTNSYAKAAAVRKALKELAAATRDGDMVFVLFSGHGQPVEDTSGDEADGWDEALVPYDAGARYVPNVYTGECHIADDELCGYVTQIRRKAGPRGYVYMVVDACHAGGVSRGEEDDSDRFSSDSTFVRGTTIGLSRTSRPYVPRIDTRSVFSIAKGKGLSGVCYLEACRSYQTNSEIKADGAWHGPLSYYVNKVLSLLPLSADSSWTERVVMLMGRDRRLTRQNPVIEKSL